MISSSVWTIEPFFWTFVIRQFKFRCVLANEQNLQCVKIVFFSRMTTLMWHFLNSTYSCLLSKKKLAVHLLRLVHFFKRSRFWPHLDLRCHVYCALTFILKLCFEVQFYGLCSPFVVLMDTQIVPKYLLPHYVYIYPVICYCLFVMWMIKHEKKT